jgi:hypothetical protein
MCILAIRRNEREGLFSVFYFFFKISSALFNGVLVSLKSHFTKVYFRHTQLTSQLQSPETHLPEPVGKMKKTEGENRW